MSVWQKTLTTILVFQRAAFFLNLQAVKKKKATGGLLLLSEAVTLVCGGKG